MKPVNLNQLLFHAKSDCISFFLSPDDEIDLFHHDMLEQLSLHEKQAVAEHLSKCQQQIKKIVRSHPDRSHGFFIAEDLQGYVILNQKIESYCIIGRTFHVRPLLEEIFVNPEFMVINISQFDIKVFRGDFLHLEVIKHYEFDQLPKNFNDFQSHVFSPQTKGLVSYKTILAMKTIASNLKDLILYHSLPVIVTGNQDMKTIFLRYFEDTFGVISHLQEDFYDKTCVEIVEVCKIYRYLIMDYYSAQLKERLKRMVKSKRLLTDLEEIIKAVLDKKIVHLVLPTEKKLWGRIDLATGKYAIHKRFNKKTSIDILNELAEEVIKQGGRIQVLGPHFFPANSEVLAILKG